MYCAVFLGFVLFYILQPLKFSMASEQRLLREKTELGAKRIQRSLDTQAMTCLEHLNNGHTLSGIYHLQIDTGSSLMVTIF